MCKYYKIFWGIVIPLFSCSQIIAQNFNMDLRASMEFPNQKIAGLWGWVSKANHEYALVGANNGMIIIDVTNPDSPEQIVVIPAPINVWKEIRTYSHYAYMVTEGGGGVLIVDLSGLPSTNLTYHYFTGDSNMSFTLDNIHALHIDEKKGVLYLYGGAGGGATYYDLTLNAYEPAFLGAYNALGYVHDGYVDNDTLYACHPYSGIMSMVDLNDKSNPVVLGTIETPSKVTHNSWLLGDRKHVLVTDENKPSYVTCYNVSDPSDITETDRISVDLDSSLAHNVQVINDWAVVSWYTAGVVILDCHRPQNIIKTGHYDTWPGKGTGFNGCWSVYPFFPSGTIISGHIPYFSGGNVKGELFVFKPTFSRACYFEGTVRNVCTGAPIPDVSVEIIGGDSGFNVKSDGTGSIRTGQATPGEFTVKFSKPGLLTHEMVITLTPGEIVNFDLEMGAVAYHNLSGQINDETGQPIANSTVHLIGQFETYSVPADENGAYEINCLPQGTYIIAAGEWGNMVSQEETITSSGTLNLTATKKYYDDFIVERGWTTVATTETGRWARGVPQPATNAPGEDDPEDLGNFCYVTGNKLGQTQPDAVSDGIALLISPYMDLSNLADANLSFKYWFKKEGPGQPGDYFKVSASNGITQTTIFSSFLLDGWKKVENIHLGDFIQLTNEMRVHFSVIESGEEHDVEAALDQFLIEPIYTNAPEAINADMILKVFPNPSTGEFQLDYESNGDQNAILEVKNTIGQVILQKSIGNNPDYSVIGQHWVPGIYFLTISGDGKPSKPIKLIKN